MGFYCPTQGVHHSHPNRPNGFSNCTWSGAGEIILPRTGVADWVNYSDSKLGSNFAWVRADLAARDGWDDGNRDILYDYARIDLAAVAELLKSRTEQAHALVSELTSRPQLSPRP